MAGWYYLFNNAGIAVGGEVRDCSIDDFRNVINVNLLGVVNGVAAAYPRMVKQGYGHIINTASIEGLVPFQVRFPMWQANMAWWVSRTQCG